MALFSDADKTCILVMFNTFMAPGNTMNLKQSNGSLYCKHICIITNFLVKFK